MVAHLDLVILGKKKHSHPPHKVGHHAPRKKHPKISIVITVKKMMLDVKYMISYISSL
jgi:hypothetical protein